MQIAQINLPLFNNDSLPISHAHKILRGDLCQHFGGFTVWDAQGAWVHNGEVFDEPVKVYQVAFDDAFRNDDALRYIARNAANAGNQLSVYLVINGKAEIIDLAREKIEKTSA